MPSRVTRVAEQIRTELGDILAREVRDPGLGFVTITRVRVTEDLLQARAFYTILGGPEERKQAARALDRALPFVRRALAQRVRLRRVPEITFTYDESIAHQARVEELLQEIQRDDAERAAAHDRPRDDDNDDRDA